MRNKIVITAANGFMGKALMNYLSENYEVVGLVRKKAPKMNHNYVLWDGVNIGTWAKELEDAYAVINLAGRSVDCRYNDKNKKEILDSRLNSTKVIELAIQQCKQKPQLWINAASATIYRHSEDTPMTELAGEIGEGFSVEVCKHWEQQFYQAACTEVRKIAIRTAIVLGKNGGVMIPFMNLVKFGLGGKMGRGNQMFSWVHVYDFCRIVEFFIQHETTEGTYNVSSPNPISNATFMKLLRSEMKIPFGLPLSKSLLELGAKVIKTETELILKSRYVIPERLKAEGFSFQYPSIEMAIKEIVSK